MGSYSYGGKSRMSFDRTLERIERVFAAEELAPFGRVDVSMGTEELLRTGLERYALLAASDAAYGDEADEDRLVSCFVVVTETIEGVFVEVTVPDTEERDGLVRIVPYADGLGARLRHAIAPLLS